MSYEPRSLNPNIMEKRINDLSKTVGSGGIGSIPIASADTVGGIMIGGSANPITITGSGNASVRKATAELLGVVKAGDGLVVNEDGTLNIELTINSNEHESGVIYGNDKEYVKEITLSNTSLTAGSNIDVLSSGTSQYKQVTECKLVYTSDTENGSMCCPVWIDVSGSKISCKPTGTASLLTSLKAILKYLKTN